jgi:PAS domain S-box-containing protein
VSPLPADQIPFYLAALVDSSNDAIVSKDLNGVITSWNRGAEQIFGYSAEEAIGRSVRLIIPADRQAEEDDVLAHIRRGERVEHFDTIRRRKDGVEIPVSLTISPIRDASGRVIGASKIARDISERRRTEQELARSRAFSERIAETSPDLLFVYDPRADRLVYANQRLEDLLGISAEDAAAVREGIVAALVPEEDMPILRGAFDRLEQGTAGGVVEYEHRIRRRDGVLRQVRVRAGVFERDANGRSQLVVGHLIDVTDEHAAEQRTAELRRRLDLLVSASAAVLHSPELADVLPATMQTARDLVKSDGYALWRATSAGEWHALSWSGVSDGFVTEAVPGPPASPAQVPFADPLVVRDVENLPLLAHRVEAYRREGIRGVLIVPLHIDGNPTGTLVFYYRTSDGPTDIDVHAASALANLAASAIRSAELYADLRRRQRQSAFLARAGSVLASSLDYAQTLTRIAELAVPEIADWCAVDIVDDDGQLERLAVTHVDPRKVELVREIVQRYPPDPSSPYGAHEVLRTGRPLMMEHIPRSVLETGARDVQHLEAILALGLESYMCVPLLGHDGGLGVLSLVMAESGRRYDARDLAFAQELARSAAAAMENARAYETARRANRLKDDFLATLSHELRTPLNAVVGYVRMLRSGVLEPERQVRALEVVERNARSLTQMVEDVLDVSRIVAGKIRLNVQPVDLGAVLRAAVATVTPAADARGVRLKTIADPLTPPVAGDPERLQQVVWNLLSNAVKFTPRGGQVQLRLERINSHVEIVVADTGIGIQPEFVPHLFERFRQADSRFAREFGGLGLGLAICRHIVEMHGGSIAAASPGEGQGATFRVQLPIMIAHQFPADAERVHPHERAVQPAMPVPRGVLTGVRVLAIDDDPDSLTLVGEILEAAGADVTPAASAAQALERLEAAPADVIVSDIGMPRTDGFALIAAIRRAESPIRAIPAIALTAYARSQDRTRALESGFEMHVSKPVDPAELVAAVRALVARTRAPRT